MNDIAKRNRNRAIVRSIALAAILIATTVAAAPWIIPPAKAEWEFVSRIDPIDDTTWAYAYSTSPYNWKGDRSLFLICTTDQTIEIRIDWMEYIGQVERPVIYRFDHDNPDSDIFWTHKTNTGWEFDKSSALAIAGADFLQRLARSERFVARVRDFNSDTHTQIFDTKGFDGILPSLLDYCPDYHPPTEGERQAAELARQQAAQQTVEVERERINVERERIEAARQKAEAERQRIEIERRRIEFERQRAGVGRQAAELARQQAEQKRQDIEVQRQRAEAEKAQIEAARQKAEAAHQQADKERQEAEDLARQRAEAELRLSEEQLALADAIRNDEERLERQSMALIEAARKRYVDAIRRKIEGEWIRPPGAPEGLLCVVKVVQLPGGGIVSVELLKSSGNPLFDRSVEAAVRATGILPAPLDPSIFDREIVITFAPEAGG